MKTAIRVFINMLAWLAFAAIIQLVLKPDSDRWQTWVAMIGSFMLANFAGYVEGRNNP